MLILAALIRNFPLWWNWCHIHDVKIIQGIPKIKHCRLEGKLDIPQNKEYLIEFLCCFCVRELMIKVCVVTLSKVVVIQPMYCCWFEISFYVLKLLNHGFNHGALINYFLRIKTSISSTDAYSEPCQTS